MVTRTSSRKSVYRKASTPRSVVFISHQILVVFSTASSEFARLLSGSNQTICDYSVFLNRQCSLKLRWVVRRKEVDHERHKRSDIASSRG